MEKTTIYKPITSQPTTPTSVKRDENVSFIVCRIIFYPLNQAKNKRAETAPFHQRKNRIRIITPKIATDTPRIKPATVTASVFAVAISVFTDSGTSAQT